MKIDFMISQLLGLLKQESKLYQSMLGVIEKEGKAAVRSELNSLIHAREEKENILMKLRLLETKRIDVVRKAAEALGCPQRDVTLTAISQRVDEPLAAQLNQAGTDLASLLNTLIEVNHRNKQLFEHSLELVRGSFNLLSDLTRCDTVYYSSGNIQRNYQTGRCVNGEI
jgi:flagellar biosynthesis/type III secretory pathway chaperone